MIRVLIKQNFITWKFASNYQKIWPTLDCHSTKGFGGAWRPGTMGRWATIEKCLLKAVWCRAKSLDHHTPADGWLFAPGYGIQKSLPETGLDRVCSCRQQPGRRSLCGSRPAERKQKCELMERSEAWLPLEQFVETVQTRERALNCCSQSDV